MAKKASVKKEQFKDKRKKAKFSDQHVVARIVAIADAFEGGNLAKFCRKAGILTAQITQFKNLKSEPSYGTILRIAKAYPQVSMDWFILNHGEMEKRRSEILDLGEVAKLQNVIKEKEKIIEDKDYIISLQKQILGK
jgi:transcriptional regulator with XRE-family HTH domain